LPFHKNLRLDTTLAERLANAKKVLGLTDEPRLTRHYGIPIGSHLTAEQHNLFEAKRDLARRAANGYIQRRLGGYEKLHYFNVDASDIHQLADIALVEAVMTCPMDRKANFDAWATRVMQNSITDWIRVNGWNVMRIPRSSVHKRSILFNTQDKLHETLGREPTIEEIARSAKMPVRKAKMIMEGTKGVPLEEILSIASRKYSDPKAADEFIEKVNEKINSRIGAENETNRKMINAFAMALSGTPYKKIGEKLGVSESRITQYMNLIAGLIKNSPKLADELEGLSGHNIPQTRRHRGKQK